jgi:AcrR family transcriptional regulator
MGAVARPPRAGTREALLQAARDEFARRGLERARVEDIARRAGISKGAFYLHFATKEDAFREIVSRFLGALHDHALRREEVEARAAAARAAGGAALAHQVEAECAIDVDLLEVLWRNRQILAAVEGASGRLYRELVGDFRQEMRALVTHLVVAGQDLRPDVHPEVVADIVVGTYEAFARRMMDMKQKPDLEGWARALLAVLHEGLVARPAPVASRGVRPAAPPRVRSLTGRSPSRSSR